MTDGNDNQYNYYSNGDYNNVWFSNDAGPDDLEAALSHGALEEAGFLEMLGLVDDTNTPTSAQPAGPPPPSEEVQEAAEEAMMMMARNARGEVLIVPIYHDAEQQPQEGGRPDVGDNSNDAIVTQLLAGIEILKSQPDGEGNYCHPEEAAGKGKAEGKRKGHGNGNGNGNGKGKQVRGPALDGRKRARSAEENEVAGGVAVDVFLKDRNEKKRRTEAVEAVEIKCEQDVIARRTKEGDMSLTLKTRYETERGTNNNKQNHKPKIK